MNKFSLIDYALSISRYEYSNVGILMAYRRTIWSGSFRVMVNFYKASRNRDKVYIILYRCRRGLADDLRKHIDANIIETYDVGEVLRMIDKNDIKIIVGDDAIRRLKVLNYIKTKRNTVKTLIYIQFLYGVRKILPIFREIQLRHSIKDAFINLMMTVYPWDLLRYKYRNMLMSHNRLVANSVSTVNLAFLLYGVNVNTVIYPPVDTDTFRPITTPSDDVITIYSGSKAIDTYPELIHDLIEIAISYELKINIFGENVEQIVTPYMRSRKALDNVRIHKNINDYELAKLYSESYIVIAPQFFELFGYVPIEAMACGAPVVAFGYLGPAETIIDGVTGFLAYTSDHMKQILRKVIECRPKFDRHYIRNYILDNFSVNAYMKGKGGTKAWNTKALT